MHTMSSGGQRRDSWLQRDRSRPDPPASRSPTTVDPNRDTNKEKREHIRHLQKEAFQLANYYFVFQGVVFTAFYGTQSSLKCEYHWIPFALSFLAGFLNLCALAVVAWEMKCTLDDMDRNYLTRRNNDDCEPSAVTNERAYRLVYVMGCMVLFVAFFVITLIGCWKITCGGKSLATAAPPPPSDP